MKKPQGLKIAVFASGRGSNFVAILQAIERGEIPGAAIVIVISNNSSAGALQLARDHNIAAVHISCKQYASDEDFTKALQSLLHEHGVNFIVLAGYMKKIYPRIIKEYQNRIINIHPALLPAFGGEGMYGRYVHEAVLAAKTAVTGATVHLVDNEYDHGAIVLQRSIPVACDDTPESLAKKVLRIEHELYPEVLKLFAAGRVEINGRQVFIIGA
ncbi:MAG: phosphoribosylglycinamide formyltransferase [Bacteroidota bacterium]